MAEKKKLHLFLGDMLKLSCVKGFKHFVTHMRGREEMICSIINEPSMPIILSAANSPATSFAQQKREALPMSHKQQRRLSGYGFINVGLPPASPSELEEDEDDNHTMFLVAAYARYNRPYIWIRTNHDRLVRLASEEEKDYPLLMQTTSQWPEKDIKVWDILSELVLICCFPCPCNPFAVDMDYFEALPCAERALSTAAMTNFLRRLLASGAHPYNRRVQSDLLKVSRLHFHAMLQLLQEGIIQLPSPSSSHHQDIASLETQYTHAGQYVQQTPSQCNPPTDPSGAITHYPIPSSAGPFPASSSSAFPQPSSSVPQSHHTYLHSETTATSHGPALRGTYSEQVHLPTHIPSNAAPPHPLPPHPLPLTSGSHAGPQESSGQFYTRRSAGTYQY